MISYDFGITSVIYMCLTHVYHDSCILWLFCLSLVTYKKKKLYFTSLWFSWLLYHSNCYWPLVRCDVLWWFAFGSATSHLSFDMKCNTLGSVIPFMYIGFNMIGFVVSCNMSGHYRSNCWLLIACDDTRLGLHHYTFSNMEYITLGTVISCNMRYITLEFVVSCNMSDHYLSNCWLLVTCDVIWWYALGSASSHWNILCLGSWYYVHWRYHTWVRGIM